MEQLRRWRTAAWRLVAGDYAAQRVWWKAAAAPLAAPQADTTEFVRMLLEAQLGRASASVKSIEDRAGLVIPAIGVVAGLFGADVSRRVGENAGLFWLAVGVAASAIISMLLALAALAPRSRSNGPPAQRAVQGTAEPLETARINYVKSLGFAVHSEEERVIAKATFLNWSIRVLVIGVILWTVFAALGGLK
jgi:tetrahydromethanopterin S-methyltransferase subunit F